MCLPNQTHNVIPRPFCVVNQLVFNALSKYENCELEGLPTVVPAECIEKLSFDFCMSRCTSAICWDTEGVGVPICLVSFFQDEVHHPGTYGDEAKVRHAISRSIESSPGFRHFPSRSAVFPYQMHRFWKCSNEYIRKIRSRRRLTCDSWIQVRSSMCASG